MQAKIHGRFQARTRRGEELVTIDLAILIGVEAAVDLGGTLVVVGSGMLLVLFIDWARQQQRSRRRRRYLSRRAKGWLVASAVPVGRARSHPWLRPGPGIAKFSMAPAALLDELPRRTTSATVAHVARRPPLVGVGVGGGVHHRHAGSPASLLRRPSTCCASRSSRWSRRSSISSSKSGASAARCRRHRLRRLLRRPRARRRAGGRRGCVGAGVGAAAADRVPERVQAQKVHVDARPRGEVGRRHVRRLGGLVMAVRSSMLGACIGKQLLRLLCHLSCVPHPLPRLPLPAQRPRPAGLRRHRSRPASPPPSWHRSQQLFVVEEAAAFSVPLPWRAFSTAYVSMAAT